jgi:hypothetical protein
MRLIKYLYDVILDVSRMLIAMPSVPGRIVIDTKSCSNTGKLVALSTTDKEYWLVTMHYG